MKLKLVLALVAATVVFAATPGEAAEGDVGFGHMGQIVPSGSVSFAWSSTKVPGGASVSDTAFTFAPTFGYFVIDNVLIGGSLLGSIRSPESGDSITGFGIAVMGGYNVNLMEKFSLLPQLSLGYTSFGSGSGDAKISNGRTGLEIFVPILWHVVPHFFLGIGPNLHTDLSSSTSVGGVSGDGDKVTTIGIMTTIGGWL
jgi:hypothetical protein